MSLMYFPQKGEIWPQSSADITVFFRAMEVGEISSVAYLEVTGREDRIPLRLQKKTSIRLFSELSFVSELFP